MSLVRGVEQRTEEWHRLRKGRVGASQIAVLARLNPFWDSVRLSRLLEEFKRSDFDLGAASETIRPFTDEQRVRMQRGTEAEAKILAAYQKAMNVPVFTHGDIVLPATGNKMIDSHFLASLDGRCCAVGTDTLSPNDRVVEAKYAARLYRDDAKHNKTSGIPVYYLCQVMMQMALTGTREADFVVVRVGDKAADIRRVKFIPGLWAALLHRALRFFALSGGACNNLWRNREDYDTAMAKIEDPFDIEKYYDVISAAVTVIDASRLLAQLA